MYIRLTFFPLLASLFLPTELGCPPGIQARLLIRGFSALFDLIGDIEEPRELIVAYCVVRGGTDACLFGILYGIPLITGCFLLGISRCCAFKIAFRALLLGGPFLLLSREPRFLTNFLGSSVFCRESPTIFFELLRLLIGPRLTISGSFDLGLENLRVPWLSERVTPETIRGDTAVATDF